MTRHTIPLFAALLGLLLIVGPPPVALADDEDELKAQLRGFEEVSAGTGAVSTVARGTFRGQINRSETAIDYELSFSGLEGDFTQAHIHVGQRGVAGGITVWLCSGPTLKDPTGLAPTCSGRSGTVRGTITRANVIGGAAAQGIDGSAQGTSPGEFAELIRAIRAGVTYANVHSAKFGPGEIRGQIRADD